MTSKFNNVYVKDAYTIASVYEKDGPIKDYFDMVSNHWNNDGEMNFLPNGLTPRGGIVVVFDKKSMSSKLVENSFGVNQQGRSVLFENGNMSRGHNYPTHRAIPVGAPSNSIDRIIVDTRLVTSQQIDAIKNKIQSQGLDIKIFDTNGNQLSSSIQSGAGQPVNTPMESPIIHSKSIKISAEIKQTFSENTHKKLTASLTQNGATATLTKGNIRYTVQNKDGVLVITAKETIKVGGRIYQAENK